jgi:O-6-methylguanine DNA methyltransferase
MPTSKHPPRPRDTLLIFPSDLGWMAAVVVGATVKQLTFGHFSAAAARKALGPLVGCVLARTTEAQPVGCVLARTTEVQPVGCVLARTRSSPTIGYSSWCVQARTLRRRLQLARTRSSPMIGHSSWCVQARTLRRRLQAFAAGKPDALGDIPIDLGRLSEFQRQVLKQCRRIPYGRTLSYAELAAKAGFPRAARAVGNCMAANRIPLIVPCHRVVRSDGRLGAYSASGGTAMKRRLLALESRSSRK